MNTIKGFVEIPSVVNNTPNQVAVLGEISDSSRTYSRIKTEYSNTNIGEYRLISMKSVNASGSNINLSSDIADEILGITKEIIRYSNENTFPLNAADLRESLLIEFDNISNVLFGTFRQNGYFTLPEIGRASCRERVYCTV